MFSTATLFVGSVSGYLFEKYLNMKPLSGPSFNSAADKKRLLEKM
jgi:hypothetical protein